MQNRNIVVIEDDEPLAAAMRDALLSCGARVAVFHDPPDPESLSVHKPDLLIVDCILKTTSGPDYLLHIQQFDNLAKVPVIVTTGVIELADVLMQSEYRYTVLEKPFSMVQLKHEVEKVLGTAH